MTDVRLTATNPEDSSVVYVACNAKGMLKLEEPIAFDGNLDGDLIATGQIISGDYSFDQNYVALRNGQIEIAKKITDGASSLITGTWYREGETLSAFRVTTSGRAVFKGDVTVGSRNKNWMLVESGGLCHMVEDSNSLVTADDFLGETSEPEYPKLRNVINELDLIEEALNTVMEKLRLTPPAGWEVWDGSDNL